jgi:predicted ATP-grasp superfamily ATP-dependent carboligase
LEFFPALITYSWCRSTYTALRSLSRLGVKVFAANSGRSGMCHSSRLKAGCWQYASPLAQPEQFVADISRILEATGARFLLPGHDETETLAIHRAALPPNVILPVAPAEKIMLANDKDRMADQAESLSLPVARRLHWRSLDELKNMLAADESPVVVKLRRGNSAKGVFYPGSASEAVQLCSDLCEKYNLAPERYPIVQQRIAGEGWGVSCLYWEGQRIASFTHRRLREKTATGGTSTLRVSAHHPMLEELTHTLLDAMQWHGLAMVEFKYDSAARQPWFIEVNPRLWGSIHLAVASGVDFPALLYTAAVEGPQAAAARVRPWRAGVVARWYLGDAIVAAGLLKRGRVLQALKMLLPGGADTLDDWFWDDPGAFLGQAAYYLATFIKTRSMNPEQEGMLG